MIAQKGALLDQFGHPIRSKTPVTSGYRPIAIHRWGTRIRDLPFFSFLQIESMLLDQTIRLGTAMRLAPIVSVEFAYRKGQEWVPGIQADKDEVASYVERQLHRIWKLDVVKLAMAEIWGWAACEIMWKQSSGGLTEFDYLLDRHARDVRALRREGQFVGMQVEGVSDKSGPVRLGADGKCIWHAHDPPAGSSYGMSVFKGAYSAWADKWYNGGALDVRRLYMHADAYGGKQMTYPPGTTEIEGLGVIPNQDIAREMVMQAKSGEVIVTPAAYDEKGNLLWTVKDIRTAGQPDHILKYPKDLDIEILRGMEIPDDFLTSGGTGAWQGKQVPMQAFYSGLNRSALSIVADVVRYILEPGVLWNFGPEDFEVDIKPIDKQAMEQQKPPDQPAQENQEAAGGFGEFGGEQPGAGGNGQPVFMSLDRNESLPELIGEGIVSAVDVVEASRRIGRSTGRVDRDYASTQFDLPPLLAAEIVNWSKEQLPVEDLAAKGLERQPHITLLYGLQDDDERQVRHLVRNQGPLAVQLGKTGSFVTSDSDVLFIEVHSQGLCNLHARLADAIPHYSSHPGYVPHVTLAYLRPGTAEKYCGLADFCRLSLVFDTLSFSRCHSERVLIPLFGAVSFARSPKGGATIAGNFYQGGQFIPKEALAAASKDELASAGLEDEAPQVSAEAGGAEAGGAEAGGLQLEQRLGMSRNEPDAGQPDEFRSDPDGLFSIAGQALAEYRAVLDLGRGVSRDLGAETFDFAIGGEFERAMKEVESQPDKPYVLIGGLKGKERSAEKVKGKYNGDWTRLRDIVRGTILVPDAGGLPKALEAIKGNVERHGWEVVSATDRFESPTEAGYRDVQLILQSKDGHLCELQVNTTRMFLAKDVVQTSAGPGGAHKLYEVARSIAEKGEANITSEEKQRVEALNQEMAKIFNQAWEESHPQGKKRMAVGQQKYAYWETDGFLARTPAGMSTLHPDCRVELWQNGKWRDYPDKQEFAFNSRRLSMAEAQALYRRAKRMAVAHAPAGGVTIGGKHFKGGEFIPSDVVAGASAAERSALQGKQTAKTTKKAAEPSESTTQKVLDAPTSSYPVANESGFESLLKHQDDQGKGNEWLQAENTAGRYHWTPERKKLHAAIQDHIFGQATPVEKPVFHVMGGGSASGKSTVLKTGRLNLPENMVTVDSDDIKGMLPEYKDGLKTGDKKSAAFVHEESSYLAKEVMKRGLAEGYNVNLDGTGDGSFKGLKKKVDAARAAGMPVVANYMSLPTEKAIGFSANRYEKTGRWVPTEIIRQTHRSVSSILPQAIEADLFDDCKLWDNDISGKPRLVMTKKRGKPAKIHSKKLWQTFLDKAKEAS